MTANRLAPCGHVWEGKGGTCTQERCAGAVYDIKAACRAKLDLDSCNRTVDNLIAKKLGVMSTHSDEYVGLVAEVERLREMHSGVMGNNDRLVGVLLMVSAAQRREGWEPRFPEKGALPTVAEAMERVRDELFNYEVDHGLAEEPPDRDPDEMPNDPRGRRSDAERIAWFRACNYMPWKARTPRP